MIRAPLVPQVADVTTRRAFDAVEQTLGELVAAPLVGAVLVGPVAIGTTDTRVYHGLGRAPRGYLLVKNPGVGVVLADGLVPEATDPSSYITLRLSFAATVTLAVF